MSWTVAGSVLLLSVALAYVIAKLWRPFDENGQPRAIWGRKD